MFRSASSADYIQRAAKVVTLVDLAGHERYFKTTAYGLTGHLPDYACLIVSANNGITSLSPCEGLTRYIAQRISSTVDFLVALSIEALSQEGQRAAFTSRDPIPLAEVLWLSLSGV